MKMLLDIIFSTDFLHSVIRLSTPILFATMAAVLSDRAGVLNIGIEGTMLFSALMGVVGSAYFGNVSLGVVCAMIARVARFCIGGLFPSENGD